MNRRNFLLGLIAAPLAPKLPAAAKMLDIEMVSYTAYESSKVIWTSGYISDGCWLWVSTDGGSTYEPAGDYSYSPNTTSNSAKG